MTATQRRSARGLTVLVVMAGAAAVLAAVAFWPRGDAPGTGDRATTAYVDATVRSREPGTCRDPDTGTTAPCQVITAELTSGRDAGETVTVEVRAAGVDAPDVRPGDEVVLLDAATAPDRYRYTFADFQRRSPVLALAGAGALALVLVGRWRGVRALLGLAAAAAVLVAFLVPALLRDQPAVPVALAAAAVIGFAALYLAHGFNMGTTVALAGTLAGLAVTAALALAVLGATHLTGIVDGRTATLRVSAEALDLRGLLIAGIVVGTVGVLDDVSVSQVSIVATLRRANPGLRTRFLYRQAIAVGRDHMASTVNTLVLAYAGVSLPLLVFFAQGDQPAGRLLTSEAIAVVVVRMLVGVIGLVASVPITTALAVVVLAPADEISHSYGRIADDPVADHEAAYPPPPEHAAPRRGRGRRGRGVRRDEERDEVMR
ncbi:MAG TPA: YibE/F family protein [Acidimicrobiales bacterium]|nr:YibE/F family protein [Acidimicrobiales bacterium]